MSNTMGKYIFIVCLHRVLAHSESKKVQKMTNYLPWMILSPYVLLDLLRSAVLHALLIGTEHFPGKEKVTFFELQL